MRRDGNRSAEKLKSEIAGAERHKGKRISCRTLSSLLGLPSIATSILRNRAEFLFPNVIEKLSPPA
jgi:hypothetical protein